jgi:hypothetical protein
MYKEMEQIDYYSNFLNYKKNYDWATDENIIEAKTHGYYDAKNYDDHYLLENFLYDIYDNMDHLSGSLTEAEGKKIREEYLKKYYDLEFNILRAFPKEKMLSFVKKNFEDRTICYHDLFHIELVKYTYHIWKKFVNNSPDNFEYPDNEFCICINKIKDHLEEVTNMTSDKYYDILENKQNPRYNPKKHYIYYTWWLYAYLPLLEDADGKILNLIKFVYLEDAQDMLLYGIYQMDTNKLAPFMKKIMMSLWKQGIDYPMGIRKHKPCFGMWETGTGAWSQMVDILEKLYQGGYDLMSDIELGPIFGYVKYNGTICSHIPDIYDEINVVNEKIGKITI